MPKENATPPIPTTPTPVTPPIAAPAAPAPSAAAPSAASAASATGRDHKGRFTKPMAPPDAARSTISASKALGLDEEPGKSAQTVIERERKRFESRSPNTPAVIKDPVIPDDETPPADPAAAAPEPAPETPPPVTPPAPIPAAVEQKVKIGDKEFTADQLAAQMKELEEFRARNAAPAIVPQEEPAAPAPPPAPTPEEIAKRESEFLKTTMEALDAPLTEKEIDTLLAGGAESVKLLQTMRRQDMARAILEARKGVAAGLNPIMQNLFNELKPLVGHHQQLRAQLVEQHFVAKHKDFVPFVEKARAVASELWRRYPDQVARMSADQFVDEVARQTGTILDREWKSFHPEGSASWRAPSGGAPAAAPQAAPVAAATPPAPTPATPPPPAAPKKVAVKPPASNAPGAPGSFIPPNWQKGVASSLR